MLNLGTLGGAYSAGLAVNDSGWAVGTAYTATQVPHAFLWRDDGKGMRDLNDLVDPTDPLKPYVLLSSAEAINDAGDIMAFGTDSRTGFLQSTYLLRGSSLALSPRSLAFGNQKVGTVSAAKSITVHNNTTSVVPITSIALKGAAAGQFASTNNCGGSLVGHAICTIKVTFKPTTKGVKSATLNVNGGGGGLRVVNLNGTGV
jgi:probable HAF family extracellular repeat protein